MTEGRREVEEATPAVPVVSWVRGNGGEKQESSPENGEEGTCERYCHLCLSTEPSLTDPPSTLSSGGSFVCRAADSTGSRGRICILLNSHRHLQIPHPPFSCMPLSSCHSALELSSSALCSHLLAFWLWRLHIHWRTTYFCTEFHLLPMCVILDNFTQPWE